MGNVTPVEDTKRHVEKLGEDFGRCQKILQDDVADLRLMFRFWRSMFASGPERVALLNRVSGLYFSYVSRMFYDAMVLKICRLTDPANLGQWRNLSLNRLLEFMDTDERQRKLTILLDNCKLSCSVFKTLRDKTIAHVDLETRLNISEIARTTMQDIERAIEDLAKVVRWVSEEFGLGMLSTHVVTPINDEVHVLQVMYDGVERGDQRELDSRKAYEDGSWRENNRRAAFPDWLVHRQDNMEESLKEVIGR